MKKNIKMLIVGVVAILVLAGVMVALLYTAPETPDAEEDTTTTEVTYTLVEENVDNFKSLSVKNPSGEFTFIGQEVTSVVDDEETTTVYYVLEELADYAQNFTATTGLVKGLTTLKAEGRVYESTADVDLAEFGLKDPQATLTMTTNKEIEIYLGNYNEGLDLYYAMIKGDEALYTISTKIAESMLANDLSYLQKKLVATYDTNATTFPVLHTLEINRDDLDLPIILTQNVDASEEELAYMSSLVMTSPIKSEMNYSFTGTYGLTIFGMTASEIVALYDEADAQTYGFDTPAMNLDFTYTDIDGSGYEVAIVVGDKTEAGGYYILFNDTGVVYDMPASFLDTMIGLTGDDLVTTLPLLPYITDVETIDFALDKDYHFELSTEEVTDDDGEVSYNTDGVTCDGEEIDVDAFKQFYQLLLSVASDAINTEEPQGDPVLSITYNYKDGTSDTLACYLIDNNRRTQITINGEALYEGRAGFVEKAKTEIVDLLEGGEVDTDW